MKNQTVFRILAAVLAVLGGLSFVFKTLPSLGITALIGAVVLLVLSMLKGTDGRTEDDDEAAEERSAQPVLRGVAGPYAGKSFDLSSTRITMGRDPNVCNVVYDKDMPGVSGNHCQIAFDAAKDQFILTDNGSSYGTFLEDGTKLEAGVPVVLKPGDTFYLAEPKNRFAVDKELE